MSKIKRRKMARGTKLTPEQIWSDGLTGVGTNINAANVANTDGLISTQYEKDKASFRLNFSIPYIGSEWTKFNGVDKPYVIPFMLPPLQEFWNVEGLSNDTTPAVTMTEFSFSFDQRDEGCMITDQHATVAPTVGGWDTVIAAAAPTPTLLDAWDTFKTNSNHGKIYQQTELAHSRGLQIEFSVLQKKSNYYDPLASSSDFHSTNEIYNIPLTIGDILARGGSVLPYADKNLNINIDPYQTYLLGIKPFQLHAENAPLALVNINISIKFKQVLVTRDANLGTSHVPDNMPQHGNQKIQDTLALNVPATSTAIGADTATGVNTSISAIDKVFQDKLQGGLSPGSDIGVVEHLCQDAGYEIIAIPMWNNQWNNQLTVKNVIANATAPYAVGNHYALQGVNAAVVGASVEDQRGPIVDRAVIPINFPMTIHHVVVAYNSFTTTINDSDIAASFPYRYQRDPLPSNSFEAAWDVPGTQNVADNQAPHQIGIAVGTGNKGMTYGYKQICNYTGNFNTNIIDRIRMNYPCSTSDDTPLGINSQPDIMDKPEWILNYLPLINGGNTVAPGLFNSAGTKAATGTYTNMQDTPMFLGNSWETPDGDGLVASPALTAFKGPTIRTRDHTGALTQRGTDQWIEIRWAIGGGLQGANPFWGDYHNDPNLALQARNADWSRILNGYAGSWIYIIGKKHTISDQNWKQSYQKKGANTHG